MDGLHKFDLALMAEISSPAQQLVAAVSSGASVLFIGQAETADCLRVLGRMLGAARTQVLHVRPPLDLRNFMEQVASAFPASGECVLERGFESLTVLGAGYERIALLVEDAHLLPHPTLRYIEMALRAGPHLQVILAGQPALAKTLDLAGFASLRQRLSVRVDAAEPRHLPPATVAPAADARRSRRPVILAGALAASVAMVAWSLHSSVAPPALPSAVVAKVMTAPGSEPLLPAVAEPPAISPSVPDAAPAPEPAVPTIVAEKPEGAISVPVEASSAIPEVASGPALAAEAPISTLIPKPVPSLIVTQAPNAPTPAPAEMQPAVPDTAPSPASPAVVAMLPATPRISPPQAKPPVAASPALPREVAMRPAPIRPERVASAQNERRCRDIVLRVQLGEVPDDADRTFLRNGCR